MPWFLRHRVRYFETDHAGVVYHSRYLEWFEVARTEFMRDLGIVYSALEKEGVFLTVAEAQVRYLGTIRYDEILQIETFVERVGPIRVVFAYRVRREGEEDVLADGRTVLASINPARRPVRLPAGLRTKLEAAAGGPGPP